MRPAVQQTLEADGAKAVAGSAVARRSLSVCSTDPEALSMSEATPPLKTCTASVAFVDGGPVFTFAASDGDVRIMQLNLWRDGVLSPQWAIVVDKPPSFSVVDFDEQGGPTKEALQSVFERMARNLVRGVGSLPVRSIRYGDVPPGFRQQSPRFGLAPPLRPGPHSLSVTGGHFGWLSFTVPGEPSEEGSDSQDSAMGPRSWKGP
jgi:hypothetical protein